MCCCHTWLLRLVVAQEPLFRRCALHAGRRGWPAGPEARQLLTAALRRAQPRLRRNRRQRPQRATHLHLRQTCSCRPGLHPCCQWARDGACLPPACCLHTPGGRHRAGRLHGWRAGASLVLPSRRKVLAPAPLRHCRHQPQAPTWSNLPASRQSHRCGHYQAPRAAAAVEAAPGQPPHRGRRPPLQDTRCTASAATRPDRAALAAARCQPALHPQLSTHSWAPVCEEQGQCRGVVFMRRALLRQVGVRCDPLKPCTPQLCTP